MRVAYRYLSQRKAAPPALELVDDDAPGPSISGARRAMAREGVRRLYAALDRLPPLARLAFALHEIEGRSMAEVATLTGASVTATKLRVWRARRALVASAAGDPVLREILEEPAP